MTTTTKGGASSCQAEVVTFGAAARKEKLWKVTLYLKWKMEEQSGLLFVFIRTAIKEGDCSNRLGL